MNLRSVTLFFILITCVSLIHGQDEESVSKLDTRAYPEESAILLDGFPISGVGSFASPQKPVLLNPAAIPAVPQTQIAFDHQRFFWGIGDPLYSSSFLYAHHFINRGLGISFGYFGSEMLATQTVAVHYGQRISPARNPIVETMRLGLFGGATARLRRRGFIES
ncbi:hypothetical protein DRQ36_11035, partial [bacterium]